MLDLNQPLLVIGGHELGILHAGYGLVALVLLLLLATTMLAWRALRRPSAVATPSDLEHRLGEMSGQLRHFAETVASRETHLARTIDQRLDMVARRTGDSLGQLNERLAVIDRAQRNISDLTSKVVSLQDILSNKQSRGAFGQARMEAIIRDGLPMNSFQFQGTLSNGMRPDCLVSLPESPLKLVIDAKFPLEAFNALKASRTDAEARSASQRLRQDIGKHIKDISGKYLIAGETHDMAVMFVPSESIYADIYEHFEGLIQQAHRARVIIASPNIMMLVVQTLQSVFKDVRMHEQAGLIKTEIGAILDDVGRLRDRVFDLQKHFGQAAQDIDKIAISADKVTRRGARIEQMDMGEARTDNHQASPRLAAGE